MTFLQTMSKLRRAAHSKLYFLLFGLDHNTGSVVFSIHVVVFSTVWLYFDPVAPSKAFRTKFSPLIAYTPHG